MTLRCFRGAFATMFIFAMVVAVIVKAILDPFIGPTVSIKEYRTFSFPPGIEFDELVWNVFIVSLLFPVIDVESWIEIPIAKVISLGS
jgi:hypothetical protein